jgi:hypothetical protein
MDGGMEWMGIERRSGMDRRRTFGPRLKSFLFYRNRCSDRREEDRRKIALKDQYSNDILVSITLVLLFSVTDALLTLLLVDYGASEMNPVMAYFFAHGPFAFIFAKYALTVLSVMMILMVNQAFIRPLKFYARDLLKYFAGGFAAVIAYELVLVARFV